MRQIIVGVAAVVSIVIVACSSSDSSTNLGAKGTTTKGDASADASKSSSDKSELETKDSSAPPSTTCSKDQGADACFECCEAKNPNGAPAYDQAMRTCLCAASACATQCAESVCAATPTEPTDGDDCSTCIDDEVECEAQAEAACAANAACSALAACIEESDCEPDVDGGT